MRLLLLYANYYKIVLSITLSTGILMNCYLLTNNINVQTMFQLVVLRILMTVQYFIIAISEV